MKHNLSQAQTSDDVNVGHRLRELRAKRGLSIRALAEQSGLNANTLSMIENNKTSPSVSTLQQVAGALKAPITAFFETENPIQSIVFQKAGNHKSASFTHGMITDLGTGFARSGLEPFIVSLEPQANSGDNPIVHTGLEFVYCLEGCIEYEVDGQAYTMEGGDSLLFEAYLPHRWRNIGEASSRLMLLLCSADEHERVDERHFAKKDKTYA